MTKKKSKNKPTSADQLEAINLLFDIANKLDKSDEEDYQASEPESEIQSDEPDAITVPVIAAIHSIIARSLMRINESEAILTPKQLLTLAKLSHVIQQPTE